MEQQTCTVRWECETSLGYRMVRAVATAEWWSTYRVHVRPQVLSPAPTNQAHQHLLLLGGSGKNRSSRSPPATCLGSETENQTLFMWARHKECTGRAESPAPPGLPCKFLTMPISLLSPNRAKPVTLCPPHGPSGHPVGSNFSTLAKGQSWTAQFTSCHILM